MTMTFLKVALEMNENGKIAGDERRMKEVVLEKFRHSIKKTETEDLLLLDN